MTTTRRAITLAVLLAAVAGGILFGVWLFDAAT
jgi:hypothetical protein